MRALGALVWKECLHVLRDRRTLAVLLLLPVVQVVLFGYAIRTDVGTVDLAVVDPAPDAASRELAARFAAGGVFRIVATLPAAAGLDRLFRRGAADAAVVFAPGFGESLGRGEPADLLVVTDATEPNTGATVASYALAVVDDFQQDHVAAGLRAGRGAGIGERGAGVGLVPRVRLRFNPTAESKNLFVPGLVAFVLTIVSSLMTAITLAREKEVGTMETLLVSPLAPWQIVAGKVAPYLAIGFALAVGVLVEGRLVFGVPMRGSVALLLAEAALFLLVSLALGVLISARAASQRVAMTAALLGTMLPTLMLSGFIFPVESMPAPLRALAQAVPAKWFIEVARGVMLKGVGLDHLWRETLVLAAMALGLLALAARAHPTRLE